MCKKRNLKYKSKNYFNGCIELFAGESIDIELNDKTNDEFIRNNNIDKSINNTRIFLQSFLIIM